MHPRRLLLLAAILALGGGPRWAHALDIPLTVQEELPDGVNGMSRTAGPVSVGIPLDSLSGITSVSQLGLSGAAAGQFRELARWPNGTLRWVLADFQADVPAGGVNATVSVVNGGGSFGGANLATDNGTSITVATGTSTFTIQKSPFRFFDGVTVGGTTLVSAGGDGFVAIDPSGVRYTSANDPSASVSVEENGPVRAVVLASGTLRSTAGARLCEYRVRLHFYQGKSYVRAWVSMRNAQAAYPTTFLFHSAEVDVPLSIGSGLHFTTASSLGTTSDLLAASETMYLFQAYSSQNGWSENAYANAPMAVSGGVFSQNGIQIAKVGGTVYQALTGSASDYATGWAALENGAGQGVTVGLRWMSALWPAGFELSGDGTARVELFSKRNSLPSIKFAWGAYETREIFFDFHTAAPGDRNQTLYDMQYPLAARAPLSQYASTGALYGVTTLVSPAQQQAYFAQYGGSSPSLANITPSFWRYHAWGTGGGGNQVDFAFLDLIDYLRTGNGGYLAQGERNSLYKADTSVRHSDGYDYYTNQIDPGWDEFDSSKLNYQTFNGQIFDFNHCHWISIPIAYYMSGNELLKEAAVDFCEWKYGMADGTAPYFYLPTINYDDFEGARMWSRYIRDFGIASDLTGDPRYWANVSIMLNFLLTRSDSTGVPAVTGRNWSRGYHYMQYETSGDPLWPVRPISDFCDVQIHFEAVEYIWRLLKARTDSRAQAVEDYLLGLADFYYNEFYFEQGDGTSIGNFGYVYAYLLDEVNNATTNRFFPPNGGNILRPISTGAAMAFAYQETGDPKYLAREGKLLPGDVQYVTNRTPTDPASEECMGIDLARPVTGWHDVPGVSTTNLGGGSYQLSWTVPAGTTGYRIKYSDRNIVGWLGFDQTARTYAFPPATNIPWYAASSVANPPAPQGGGSVQTITLTGFDPTKSLHFGVRYNTTIADTTPPAAVRDLMAR